MRKILMTMAALSMMATVAQAQEIPTAKPQKEHEWLQRFVGEWETESEVSLGSGQPAMKCHGTMEARQVGPFFVVLDMTSEMFGVQIHALQTMGYASREKKYVATWIDSSLDHLWKYDGAVNEAGDTLTMESEGPNFITGDGTAKYRDVYKFTSQDRFETTSFMQQADGEWTKFVTGVVERKK